MAADPFLRLRRDRRDVASRLRLLDRVRAEFTDLPSLRLTPRQVQRLFGFPADVCERMLGELERERSVVRDSRGRYGGVSNALGAARPPE